MGIPRSAIDKFPPHVQKQINRQLAKKTRLEEIVSTNRTYRAAYMETHWLVNTTLTRNSQT